MKNKVENEQLNMLAISGWLLFREFMPELNQKIEIYWSTDETTKLNRFGEMIFRGQAMNFRDFGELAHNGLRVYAV